MPIAADYPFLDVMWSMFVFFAFVIWIWLLITVFADIFRRRDCGGWTKALWVVFVIVLPYIGVLAYLIVQHRGIAERSGEQIKAAKAQQDEYIKSVAGTGSAADQIAQAKQLLDGGTISQSEFDALKQKALA
ncbi:MAG TPA: SHOCT domain-containing protein [Conexibacter sp.]|nr:SHOCT domain-containing protein [Conexibacter sp.]